MKKFPAVGETLNASESNGRDVTLAEGGKGSNQAIMCAKLTQGELHQIKQAHHQSDNTIEQTTPKRHVFIGCVGDDANGQQIIANYQKSGAFIDVPKHCRIIQKTSSGHASIWVQETTGDNMIVLAMGANNKVTKQHVQESLREAKDHGCSVFLTQLEIPLDVAVLGLQEAKKLGMLTIFNPAPGRQDIPQDVWQYVDIVCPNETEAAIITGKSKVEGVVDAGVCAQWFIKRGVKTVIITLGSQGCVVCHQRATIRHVKAHNLGKVVDTTGAGDCFLGSLSYFLSCDVEVMDAVKWSNYIASQSVLRKGCQTSYPTRTELIKEQVKEQ